MAGQNPYPATPSAANALIPNLLDQRQVSPFVIYQQQGFTMSKLANMLAVPTKSRSGQRKVEQYTLGNTLPVATIASRTAVGSSLVLTWTNADFNGFIVDEVMTGGTERVAQVDAHSTGSVTIKALGGSFAAGDFAVGAVVNTLGVMSGPGSYGPESKYYNPNQRYNVIGTTRANCTLTRDDISTKTWVNVDGQPYWTFANLDIGMADFNRINDMRMWNAPRIEAGGDGNIPGGFKWQMKNQGATLQARTGPLTENSIGDFINSIINNGNCTATEFLVPVGSAYLKQFQENVARDYIVQAGWTNVVGGQKVKGMNALEYGCQGITFKFIPMMAWNNRNAYGTPSTMIPGTTIEQNNAWYMDTSDVMTSQGKKPFLEKWYFSDNMDMGLVPINGMIDQSGQWVKTGAASSRDAFSIELIDDCATLLSDPTKQNFSYISE